MADEITKKLDDMRRHATEHLHEARSIVSQMNTLESVFELPLTELSSLETSTVTGPYGVPLPSGTPRPPESRNGSGATPARRSPVVIRPDEYFAEEPMEAAKKFMRGVGHAVSFDEITEAVQKGGAAISGADWRDRLEISLKRSPYQVITVADKTYGLAEFYTEEQLKRFRDTRRDDSGRAGKKRQKPARPKSKAKAAPRAKARNSSKAKADTPASTESESKHGETE